jgi:hypothetical protein
VEGICTRQLADAVVVLFFPNEQNLVGLQEVCQRIRNEAESGLMKRIRLHFVMSNVPDLDDEDRVLRRRLKLFEEELSIDGLDAVIHRYESAMLFNQAVFVLERPKSRLAGEYKRLVRKLIASNPADRDGALLFLTGYCRAIKHYLKEIAVGDLKLTPFGATLLAADSIDYGLPGSSGDALEQIAGKFPDDVEIQAQVIRCRQVKAELGERYKEATSDAPQQ